MSIKTRLYRSATDDSLTVCATVEDTFLNQTAIGVMRMVAEAIAARFVEEHYAEIASKLDQNAIANLAIAEASKKIAEEIQRQPNVFHTTEQKTSVYQRGIFGGMRRIR